MKRFFAFLLLTLSAIGAAAAAPARAAGKTDAATIRPAAQTLHEGWSFKQRRGYNWYPAQVPGVVHTDLMANGIIEDPFFRLNERGVQWVDKEDWIYRTTFDADPEVLGRNNISIVFEGLDTYADVKLNGDTIIRADNMFRTWTADVKALLKDKGNELEVYFHSPIKVAMPMWEATPWREIIESGNDQSANGGVGNRRLGVFTRKAGYHYGWDWGPRLVTSGIWKPVRLEAWDGARINNVRYIQRSVDTKQAVLEVVVEVLADRDVADARLSLENRTGSRREASQKVALHKGLNTVKLNFTVKNPRLWWTNGLGEQFLYDFEAVLETGGRVRDAAAQRLGLRSIRLVTQPDQWGESFYFELNGVPVFAKGANYIPCDNFLPRITEETYRKTIEDAVAANMNILRVWGGGIYEDEVFYDLCDRHGILVWQDFMFACALYPAEGELMENMRREAVEQVRRLRNRTCLALWCGNNECLDMWFHWGVKRRFDRHDPEWSAVQWKQMTDLYNEMLPAVVAEHNPETGYRKSSPYADDYGMRSDSIGDRHYWDVWGQGLDLRLFNTAHSRFFSEYGFQSFPEFSSVLRFAPEERDWDVMSEVMLWHQRATYRANERIDRMLRAEYGEPRSFADFTYMSQLMQGDAMKMAMETHRRDMPFCMGSLIWQHNDCWPVASWSGRDWYGRWKAQHYFMRKAFDDILLSPVEEDGVLKLYIVSDRLKETRGMLTINVYALGGGSPLEIFNSQTGVPANTSTMVWSSEVGELLGGAERSDVVVAVEYRDQAGRTYTSNWLPARNGEMNFERNPHIHRGFEGSPEGGYDVTLRSDVFVRGVFLTVDGCPDNFFSDNFFDLLPGKPVTVNVSQIDEVYEIENQLSILSLANALK